MVHAASWSAATSSTARVDTDDQPGVLGDLDEGVRRQQSTVLGDDAHQGLGPDDARRRQLDDGLIEHMKPSGRHRLTQQMLRVQAGDGPRAQFGVEDGIAVTSGVLGPIEREVRLAIELVAAGRAVTGDRDADARRRHDRLASRQPIGLTQGLEDPQRDQSRLPEVGQSLEHDDEFVTTQPREQRIVSQCRPDPAGDLDQHQVAGRVSQRVVDQLEAVEVEQQQRDLTGALIDAVEGL